ncbi:TonB-dependent siderophore receptor [Paenalcaligenes sp. Me52]|uniref:TonB-dependent siderophore receptor n=1 Tax=Paenalcaligenes sp. Me52 TaxID=3392038 RepID=UPI003D27D95A
MSRHTANIASRRLACGSVLSLRLVTAAVMSVGMMGVAASVQAQDAAVSIDISARSLDDSLIELGRQTSLQFFYTPDVVGGIQVTPVKGVMTPEQALQRMLAGTPVQYRRQGRNVTLSRDSASAAGETTQLSAIRVAGKAATDIEPAYAGGQVATGGRMGLLGNKDVMDTPFNVVSYTDRYIQDKQAQELSSIIAATDPGVFNNGASGMIMDSFSLRGFSVSNSDIALGGLYGMVPYWRITPEFVERVEVQKGPAAMLNGMPPGGSVGGSINLVPKRAGDEPLARLTGTYAEESQFGTHIDLGRRFGEDKQFGVRFNAMYRDGDGAVNGQSKRADLASLGLDWRTDRVRISADLYTNKDHVRGLNRGISLDKGMDVPEPPKPDTLLAPDWTFSTTEDKAALLHAEVDITDRTMAYANYGRSKTKFNSLASSVYTVFNEEGDYKNNVSFQRMIYKKDSADAGIRTQFNTGSIGHELAFNASYYHHDYYFGFQRNMMPTDWITNIYDPKWGPKVDTSFRYASLPKSGEVTITSFGVADMLSFFDERLQLTVGIRHQNIVSDTYNTVTGARSARYDEGAYTPTVAVLYKVTDQVSLYGNYIQGLSQGATAPVNAANAGEVFAPYKTKQHEVGVKWDSGSLITTLSAFEIKRPSSYTDPVTNVFSFDGEQRNRGLEFGFMGEPSTGLRVLGGVAYTQAKMTRTAGGVNQGRFATSTPRWQAKAGVEWDFPYLNGLTLTANAVATSKQYINVDNSLSVAGRTIFDVGARYNTVVAGRNVTLRAQVLNVGNKAYWAGSLSSGLGAPRTIMFSASVDF